MVVTKYQASYMGTQKWHPLFHLMESSRHLGGMQFLGSDFYENFHKPLKIVHARTLKISSIMDVAVRKKNEKLVYRFQKIRATQSSDLNAPKLYAMNDNSRMLIRSRHITTLEVRILLPPVSFCEKHRSKNCLEIQRFLKSLAATLRNKRLRAICNLKLENVVQHGWEIRVARHKTVFLLFAFLTGSLASSYNKHSDEDVVLIQCENNHYLK